MRTCANLSKKMYPIADAFLIKCIPVVEFLLLKPINFSDSGLIQKRINFIPSKLDISAS